LERLGGDERLVYLGRKRSLGGRGDRGFLLFFFLLLLEVGGRYSGPLRCQVPVMGLEYALLLPSGVLSHGSLVCLYSVCLVY